MGTFLDTLAPKFPGAPTDQFKAYPCSNLAIIETSFMMYGDCACDHYHFLLSICNPPHVLTNNKLHSLKTNSLFPCNPGQPHKAMDFRIAGFKAYVIYVDNVFLKNIAKTMFNSDNLEMNSLCFGLSPNIKNLMNYFIQESSSMQPGSELQLQSLSMQIAVSLLREGSHNLSFRSLDLKEYIDKKSVKKAVEYLEGNYYKDITLDELAHEMNYSPYHFLRIFRSSTGMTPSEYLMNIRIDKAKSLLKHTNFLLEQISDMCGFSSGSYFSQAFKRITGMVPTAYKKNV